MAVLAFDCCLGAISVAVDDGLRVTHISERMSGGQAERLMPMIEAALQDATLAYRDITRIAVTLGPGGFTSVRVGIAAARGLALALGVPAVGQSTLAALAAAALDVPSSGLPAGMTRIVATIPAGRGALYWQDFDLQVQALSSPRVIEADAFSEELLSAQDAVVGPAAQSLVAGLTDRRAVGCVNPDLLPRADILARYAKHLTPAGELRPIYLRAADAKPQIGKALPRA